MRVIQNKYVHMFNKIVLLFKKKKKTGRSLGGKKRSSGYRWEGRRAGVDGWGNELQDD